MDSFSGEYDLVLNKDETIKVFFEYAEFEVDSPDEIRQSIKVTHLLYNGEKVYKEDLSEKYEQVVRDSLSTHLLTATDGGVH